MSTESNGTATDNGAQTTDTTPQGTTQEKMIPYARFKEVVDARQGLETTLNSLVDGMVEELPEPLRALVPASLPPQERAAWIRSAKAKLKDIFMPPAPSNSPDPQRPKGKSQIDISDMSSLAKIQAGYGKK